MPKNISINKTKLFGVPITITSLDSALALMTGWLTEYKEKGKRKREKGQSRLHPSSFFPRLVVTPNPEIIVAAQTDRGLMAALQAADLAIPDGHGVVWALRLLEGKRPSSFFLHPSSFSRISGLALMEALIAEAGKRGWKVMLLGGKPGVAAAAAQALQQRTEIRRQRTVTSITEDSKSVANSDDCCCTVYRFTGYRPPSSVFRPLKIVALSGPPDITSASPAENGQLISQINSFKPGLLFVGFGHGKQETWLTANRERLNARVVMAVGGAIDQIADPSLRPPLYIDSIGLGWLYRLARQPWRIRRQLALVKFLIMVAKATAQRA